MMKKAKLFSAGFFALCQLVCTCGFAQQGKDGAGNITTLNSVVNIYTSLQAGGYAGSTTFTVSNASGFASGDLVFIIQMYGAVVKAYSDPNNNNNSLPNDTSYGKITAYNSAGLNEFAQVRAVSGAAITLDCGLKNKYDSTRAVQVIRVPRYTSLTLTSPGTITCPAWNGATGGVVVIEVQGNTVINTNASINASGLGYRGGFVKQSVGYGATNTGSWWPDNGAVKGESIVGDTTWYHNTFSGSLCKANVANGGGGGDAMNCGGGGGSNGGVIASWNGMGNPDLSTANNITSWNLEPAGPVNGSFRPTSSSGGGRGGYAFSGNNSSTADPIVTGPNNAIWGGDERHNDGGWGGIPLDYSGGRLFMGGGGGAGDSNDGYGTAGAAGGGIVYLMSYGTVSGGGQILANGGTANSTINTGASFGNCAGIDGAGGGGGGGAVIINSVGAITLTNGTPISATGGKGGDVRTGCNFTSTSQNFGPGGGGGGGYVATSGAVVSNVSGGANGIVVSGGGNSTRIATKFPPNGATSGGAGGTGSVTNFYLTTTNYTICAGSPASLSVTIGGTPPGGISVNWYSTNAGGSPIGTGNPFGTGPLTAGTYTYYAGTCPGTYRAPVVVTVLTAPTVTATATPTVICSGQSTVLTGSGASTYTWSANAGSATTSTVSVSPTSGTTYTVTGANGNCTVTQTVAVTVNSAPTLTATANPVSVCSSQSATLTASGAATYTWSANAGSVTTSTASVAPTSSTTYTVTGANGTCTSTQTVAVSVTPAPTLSISANPASICVGQSTVLTASGASSYTWSANAGSANTSTVSVSPGSNATYTVTGANGSCTATQTIAVAVGSAPSLSITATPTAVCAGQSTVLSASGATSYTWSANAGSATTSTVSVSPGAPTTYTVTGDNAGCVGTQTISVAITTAPSLTTSASPAVICSGQNTVLSASGAASYTWSANAGSATTSTVTVTPSATTTYTVTGDNGGCTSTETVAVTVNASPSLTITATPAAICQGQSTTLSGSGAASYTWSANAGSVNTPTVSVTPNSSTSYTLTGDNGGCPSTQVISVTVNSGPTAADSALAAAACGQANGSYTITTISGGTPGYQVNFNNTGFTPVSSLPYSVSGLPAGIYPVVLQDNNGCTYTTSITISNLGGITQVDTSTGAAVCNPSNSGHIVLSSVTGGTSPFTVSLNGGAFTPIVSFPDTIKNLNAGTYTVVVQDNAGCQYPMVINVGSIGAITQVSATSQNAKCLPANSGALVLGSVSGGTSPYQYSLNGGPLTNIPSFPDSIKNLMAGSYTLVIQDAAGCSNSTVVNVGSETGPGGATVSTTDDTCNTSVGSFAVTNVTGGTPAYQYSLNGGPLQASGIFTGLAGGSYTVTVLDNNGCMLSVVDTVATLSAPSPTITALGATTFCQGGSVVLSSSSSTGNTWSTGAATQTITVTSAGSYTVSVTQNGCTASSNTIVVTVNPLPAVSVNAAVICSGTSATLTASGGATYTWSPSGGLSSANGASVTASPGATVVYTVTATDGNGCIGSNSATVTVNPAPNAPLFTPDTLYYCLYQATDTLTAITTPGATVSWYNSAMNPLPGAPLPSSTILGATTYFATQALGSCVSATAAVVVIVVPGPNAAFTHNPVSGDIIPGTTVTFTPVQQNAGYVYVWNFGDFGSGSSNTSNAMIPTHEFWTAGTYCPQLYLISPLTGCVDSNLVCLEVINGLNVVIPNIFTPNGDQINDVFSIKTEGISELSCDIYDRWGLKLYSWNGLTGSWDGTYQGKKCADGTYYYVVNTTNLKGVVESHEGFVQLLK
jgi:gliding motility-associated-like protein